MRHDVVNPSDTLIYRVVSDGIERVDVAACDIGKRYIRTQKLGRDRVDIGSGDVAGREDRAVWRSSRIGSAVLSYQREGGSPGRSGQVGESPAALRGREDVGGVCAGRLPGPRALVGDEE